MFHVGGGYVCARCAEEKRYKQCRQCGDVTLNYRTLDGICLCAECYEEHATPCSICKTVHYDNNLISIGRVARSINDILRGIQEKESTELVCADCYKKEFAECFSCRTRVKRDQLKHDDRLNEDLCQRCTEEQEEADKKGLLVYGQRLVKGMSIKKSARASLKFPIPLFTGCEIEVEKTPNFDSISNELIKNLAKGVGCSVVHDGSLNNGLEFVTRPAQGADLATLLRKVTRELQTNNVCIRKTCGLHVHIGARHLSHAQVRQVAKFYLIFEDLIFDMLPKSRRNNRYCIRMSKAHKITEFYEPKKLDCLVYGREQESYSNKRDKYDSRRYSALNLHSYFYRGTIEFRHHSGSINYTKIKNWINILHLLVSKGLETSDGQIKKLRKETKTKRREYFLNKVLNKELAEYYTKRVNKFKTSETDDEDYRTEMTDAELNNLF